MGHLSPGHFSSTALPVLCLTYAVPAVIVDSVPDHRDLVAVVVGVESVAEVVVDIVKVPRPPVVSPGVVSEPLHVITKGHAENSGKYQQRCARDRKGSHHKEDKSEDLSFSFRRSLWSP